MSRSTNTWTAVDEYFAQHLMPADPVLQAALDDSAAAGLPAINVAPNQGKLLMLLAKMQQARRILEIGTLGGYSTIWLARGLSAGGRLITLEYEPKHAAVATRNLHRAGLSGVVEIRQGRAIDSLNSLIAEQAGAFDLIFIDADKQSTTDYFQKSLQLSRVGSVIIVDNVVRDGNVIDAASADDRVQGIRRFVDHLGKEGRVLATGLQTVGAKSYDGFILAWVQQV